MKAVIIIGAVAIAVIACYLCYLIGFVRGFSSYHDYLNKLKE